VLKGRSPQFWCVATEKTGRKKLLSDVGETPHRITRKATDYLSRTVPPGERPDERKGPEEVARGKQGGSPKEGRASQDF